MTAALAQLAAAQRGRSAAAPNVLVPGRMMISTPTRPTAEATQRRQPTTSPRSGIDKAVIRIGDTKLMAVASATGSSCKLAVNRSVDPTVARPRRSCSPGCPERRTPTPPFRSSSGKVSREKITYRIQAISGTGSELASTFVSASAPAKNTVDATMSKIPREGASRRAAFAPLDRAGDEPGVPVDLGATARADMTTSREPLLARKGHRSAYKPSFAV